MQPSDFCKQPYESVLKKTEHEIVACNIMVILNRTGNTWRELSWNEYQQEREKDGNFSLRELESFDLVIGYCKSEDTAKLFSPNWK